MGCKCCRGVDPPVDEDEALNFFDAEDNECRWDDLKREVSTKFILKGRYYSNFKLMSQITSQNFIYLPGLHAH